MVLRGAIFIQAFITSVLIYSCHRTLGKDVQGFLSVELNEADQARACYNFSVVNEEKKEFYSPNFPNNYPNNTECILSLTAPYGHVIHLDFRDHFHLEDSPTCEYDRLEIRDGPHGYSNLIQKFCGEKYPPLVTSTDRYLWLKFYSDDSIEYQGFRAIYQFVHVEDFERPPAEECIFHRGGPGGVITNEDISKATFNYSDTWKVPLDCTWVIKVQKGWKMYINFKKYDLKHPNNCELNFIDIYAESRSVDSRLAHFCGTATEPQKADGNIVHVRYFAEPDAYGNFVIIYTAFRESDKCDKKTEFNCDDGTCIDKSLKCNKLFNCKYRYDEDPSLCTPATTAGMVLTSEHMIIILVVFFALVMAMCASIIITCYNKVKDRREKKREYKMRRSKEVSIEGEMDRTMSNMDPGLEAALAAQAAEIGAARRKVPRWVEDEEETNGCYVPDMDFGIFPRKNPNGGSTIPRIEEEQSPPPSVHIIGNTYPDGKNPTCREHGDSIRSGSISPPLPPPPPPPPPFHLRERRINEDHCDNHCQKHNRHNAFRSYLAPQQEEEVPQRFRAEAVIELSESNTRPRSFESTRSAPDVIVHR